MMCVPCLRHPSRQPCLPVEPFDENASNPDSIVLDPFDMESSFGSTASPHGCATSSSGVRNAGYKSRVSKLSTTKSTKKAYKGKGKKSDKPKRPLSAYNLFFHHERKHLLDRLPVRPQGKPRRSHGKMGFVQMVRLMGKKWKALGSETKSVFEAMAAKGTIGK